MRTDGDATFVDVGELLRRAVDAARRGDLDGVERALTRLRGVDALSATEAARVLPSLARAVRAHPSFSAWRVARAG